jgi:hypothetical protein
MQERLIDKQSELVGQIVAPMRAEHDHTVRRISDDNQALREEIAGLMHKESHQLREELTASVLSRIEAVADEHRQFRGRLAAAAAVAEQRFGAFARELNARIEQMAAEGIAQAVPQPAVSSAQVGELAWTMQGVLDQQQRLEAALGAIDRRVGQLDPNAVEELSRTTRGILDQQQRLEAAVGAIQKRVGQLDPNASGANKATRPSGAKKAPARSANRLAAPKRPRP